MHGARSDFRWIARSRGLRQGKKVDQTLCLGRRDKPCAFGFWRCLAAPDTKKSTHIGGFAYPSRAQDTAGRSGFLELQIAEWIGPELPAALAALLMLPIVRRWSDDIWWDRRQEQNWLERDSVLEITTFDCQSPMPKQMDPYLDSVVAKAIDCLNLLENDRAGNLERFYASLLAGDKPAILHAPAPLDVEALAALLLPLPRAHADRLSGAGWIPSRQIDLQDLAQCWDIAVLPEDYPAQVLSRRAESQLPNARKLGRALLENRPQDLSPPDHPSPEISDDPGQTENAALQLAIWGPSSAGKTVLMAQLFLEHFEHSDWLIARNKKVLNFIDSMKKARLENLFPHATPTDLTEQLKYEFYNRSTNIRFSLMVEDRAGAHYEAHDEKIREIMNTAQGLLLLIDPHREKRLIFDELDRLFSHMQAERTSEHPQDPRPIAVCISKADDMIAMPADLRHAREKPHEFVATRDRWDLVSICDRYCANYRFFPVSAVGVDLRHGVAESNTFYDENLGLRVKSTSRSFNLMEPFLWLVGESGRNSP